MYKFKDELEIKYVPPESCNYSIDEISKTLCLLINYFNNNAMIIERLCRSVDDLTKEVNALNDRFNNFEYESRKHW